MAKKNLLISDIYDKDFKTKVRGYDPVDVDNFLDLIMQDYEAYDNELKVLRNEVVQLRQKLQAAQQGETLASPDQHRMPTPPSDNLENSKPGTTMYDILRRISNLEKHVFGKGNLDN